MEQKEKSRRYFDSIAEEYDNSHDGKFVNVMYEPILKRAMELAKGTERILDLGCGNGNVLALLAEKTKAKLYGVDLSEQMIKEAGKRLGEKAAVTVGDSEHLPYEKGKFDLIICNASFHHYTSPVKALKEMKRVLKPGGTLLLGDPTVPFHWYLKIVNWALKYSNGGDYHLYGEEEIKQLLVEEGFVVSSFEMINNKNFLLCAEG